MVEERETFDFSLKPFKVSSSPTVLTGFFGLDLPLVRMRASPGKKGRSNGDGMVMGVMKRIVALVALTLLAIPAAALAQEALPPLTISAAPRAQPIAISALKNLGGDDDHGVSETFGKVLKRDLTLSSFFRILDPKSYVEDPQNSGFDHGQFTFS